MADPEKAGNGSSRENPKYESATVLEMEGVGFRYPGTPHDAVDGVDLRVEEGEFVVLVGPNGSGKSTLCRLASGLLLPSRGRIRAFGLDTAEEDLLPTIRSQCSLVLQNPDHQLLASTVREDVAFGLSRLGLEMEEIRERVDEVLAFLGIDSLADRDPLTLSMGERKKVALAGALVRRPRLLISDESTGMLDPASREEIMEALISWKERSGAALLHATHREEEVAMADRAILLNGGRAVFTGRPMELFDLEEARELGLAPPPLVELARELARRGHPLSTPRWSFHRIADSLSALVGHDDGGQGS